MWIFVDVTVALRYGDTGLTNPTSKEIRVNIRIATPPTGLLLVVLALGLVGCFMPALLEWGHAEDRFEQMYLASTPLLPEAELRREARDIYDLIISGRVTVETYFPLLDRIEAYRRLCEVYWRSHRDVPIGGARYVPSMPPNALATELATSFLSTVRGNTGAFEAARDSYKRSHDGLPFERKGRLRGEQMDTTRATELLAQGYLWSLVFAVLFFGVRVHSKEASVLLELPRIALAVLLWPFMVWKYPTDLVRVEQLRRMLQFVTYAIAGALSAGAAGGPTKAPGKKETTEDESPALFDDPRFSLLGYVQVESSPGEWGLTKFRILPGYANTSVRFGAEVELVDASHPGSNWLRTLFATGNLGGTKVTAGRVVTAAGYALPPPNTLTTIRYPWKPFASYGWGAQVASDVSERLTVVADITGKTGVSFDSREAWRGVETSGRLTWRVGGWSWSLTVQEGNRLSRFGVDTAWSDGAVAFRGGLFGSNGNGSPHGGYVLATYRLGGNIDLHGQVDAAPTGTETTLGIGWRTGSKGVSATLDAVRGGNDGATLFARFQYAF